MRGYAPKNVFTEFRVLISAHHQQTGICLTAICDKRLRDVGPGRYRLMRRLHIMAGEMGHDLVDRSRWGFITDGYNRDTPLLFQQPQTIG